MNLDASNAAVVSNLAIFGARMMTLLLGVPAMTPLVVVMKATLYRGLPVLMTSATALVDKVAMQYKLVVVVISTKGS